MAGPGENAYDDYIRATINPEFWIQGKDGIVNEGTGGTLTVTDAFAGMETFSVVSTDTTALSGAGNNIDANGQLGVRQLVSNDVADWTDVGRGFVTITTNTDDTINCKIEGAVGDSPAFAFLQWQASGLFRIDWGYDWVHSTPSAYQGFSPDQDCARQLIDTGPQPDINPVSNLGQQTVPINRSGIDYVHTATNGFTFNPTAQVAYDTPNGTPNFVNWTCSMKGHGGAVHSWPENTFPFGPTQDYTFGVLTSYAGSRFGQTQRSDQILFDSEGGGDGFICFFQAGDLKVWHDGTVYSFGTAPVTSSGFVIVFDNTANTLNLWVNGINTVTLTSVTAFCTDPFSAHSEAIGANAPIASTYSPVANPWQHMWHKNRKLTDQEIIDLFAAIPIPPPLVPGVPDSGGLMAKISIDAIRSGYSTSKLNNTLQKIVDELNNNVLYRRNPTNTQNQMFNNIDMNSNKLVNLDRGTDAADSVTLAQVIDIAGGGSGGGGIGNTVDGDLVVLGDITGDSPWTVESSTSAYPNFVLTNSDESSVPVVDMTLAQAGLDSIIRLAAYDASDIKQSAQLEASFPAFQVPHSLRLEHKDKVSTKDFIATWDDIATIPTFTLGIEDGVGVPSTEIILRGSGQGGAPLDMRISGEDGFGKIETVGINVIKLENVSKVGEYSTIASGFFGVPFTSMSTEINGSSVTLGCRSTGGTNRSVALDKDGFFSLDVSNPTHTADNHAASKKYVDDTLTGAGGGLGDLLADGSVPLTAGWDLDGNKITTSFTPVAANDLANKAYVDAVAGLGIVGDTDIQDFDLFNIDDVRWRNSTTAASTYTATLDDVGSSSTLEFTTTTNDSEIILTTRSAGGTDSDFVFQNDGILLLPGTPTAAQHAATLGFLTATYLPLAGGSTTGNLTVVGQLGSTDPTSAAGVGDRGFNDARYLLSSATLQAGIAVAGGKITSDGSGSQDVTNCFGVASATISGSGFRVTLSSAITVDEDMVVTATAGTALVQLSAQWVRITDTEFDVFLTDSNDVSFTTTAVNFTFSVYDAGA